MIAEIFFILFHPPSSHLYDSSAFVAIRINEKKTHCSVETDGNRHEPLYLRQKPYYEAKRANYILFLEKIKRILATGGAGYE